MARHTKVVLIRPIPPFFGLYLLGILCIPIGLGMISIYPLHMASLKGQGLKAEMQRAQYFNMDGGWLRLINPSGCDDMAAESFKAALSLKPKEKDLWTIHDGLADVALRQRNFKSAITSAKTALAHANYDYQRDSSQRQIRISKCCLSSGCKDQDQVIDCTGGGAM
jgi:hypothetical protein